MDVKEIDILKEGMLLPPHPNVCQLCGFDHEPPAPHNYQSLYYKYRFLKDHDRWPTWADACAHCSDKMKNIVKEIAEKVGAWEPCENPIAEQAENKK